MPLGSVYCALMCMCVVCVVVCVCNVCGSVYVCVANIVAVCNAHVCNVCVWTLQWVSEPLCTSLCR